MRVNLSNIYDQSIKSKCNESLTYQISMIRVKSKCNESKLINHKILNYETHLRFVGIFLKAQTH